MFYGEKPLSILQKSRKNPAKMRDMTLGNPVRLILSFATPMLIGNVFQQIYTMVDTMEMGYFVGDAAISAVGAASSVYNLLMSLIISMMCGTHWKMLFPASPCRRSSPQLLWSWTLRVAVKG